MVLAAFSFAESTMWEYIWVVLTLVWPSIFDTDLIGTPFSRVTVVAKVWRAEWKVISLLIPQTADISYLFRTIPVPVTVEKNHRPRPYASECAGMRVGVEGAAKSLHLPRLHALQVTPEGVSVEGDFV